MKKENVPEYLIDIGQKVQNGWREAAKKHGLAVSVSGIAPLGHFSFDHDNPLVLKTLFTQLMLDEGYLATNAYYASYAHKDKEIYGYAKATDNSFAFISKAIIEGDPKKYLKGPVCHSGFKRLT